MSGDDLEVVLWFAKSLQIIYSRYTRDLIQLSFITPLRTFIGRTNRFPTGQ